MRIERTKTVPVWVLGLLIAFASAGITLSADRASVAATAANHEARLQALEKQAEQTNAMHFEILRTLGEIRAVQQQIIDRQDEVRRKLKIIQ